MADGVGDRIRRYLGIDGGPIRGPGNWPTLVFYAVTVGVAVAGVSAWVQWDRWTGMLVWPVLFVLLVADRVRVRREREHANDPDDV